MKPFIMPLLLFSCLMFLPADSNAVTDSISLCANGISIHPGNQDDFGTEYDRKLDSRGNLIFTPGFVISYDMGVTGEWYSHVRFTGGYMDDCAKLPAGFAGAGVMCPIIDRKYISLDAFLGGGLFCRRDWTARFENHYSPVLQKAGPVEWIIAPFPGIELSLHLPEFPVSLVASFSTVIYVSQLCGGVKINF